MTPPLRPSRLAPRPPRVLLLVVLAVFPLLLTPLRGAAQVEEVLSEREFEYSAARNAYQAALDARAAVERRFTRALDEVEAARRSGDQNRLERAYAQAQSLAVQLQSLERRVDEMERALEEARSALLEVLDSYLDELLGEAARARDPAERESLAAIIRDVNNRFNEIQRETPESRGVEALPEITFDPRDGPVQLRAKAELLERRGNQWESQLLEIDRQIQELRRWQRRNRTVRDFLAGIERFDDTRVPVGPPAARTRPPTGTEGARPPAGDTSGVGERPLTLEERIANLEALRARLEDFIAQVRVRAEQFRRRAGGVQA